LGGARLADLFDAGVLSTPAYVYDLDAIAEGARALSRGFGDQRHLVAYAVKANSAGPVLRALVAEGVGADVVSGAEARLALGAGAPPEHVVMSGVAKTDAEIDFALGAGDRGILSIHAESVEELPRIDARARAVGRVARVSLRINPGIEADTHAHIATGHDEAKFGVPRSEIGAALDAVLAAANLVLVGMSSHIGSQLTAVDEYVTAASMLLDVVGAADAALAGAGRPALELVDFGGGFGIDYGAGCPVTPADFAARAAELVHRRGRSHMLVVVEPGRSLVGAHGVLVATTIMQKRARPNEAERRWLMIDAGMNDLLRPALYGAVHRIEPLAAAPGPLEPTRVVGPVCESSDDFGTHLLPEPPPARVVVRDAGAYGFTMASEYNGRALPLEAFLCGGRVVQVLRPRSAEAWVRERLGDEAFP
jgi:diaminopimelate decarboxylase